MGSSAPPTPPPMTLVSLILTPSTLTPRTAPSSMFVWTESLHESRDVSWDLSTMSWASSATTRRMFQNGKHDKLSEKEKNIYKSFFNFQQRLLCLPRWGGCQKKEVILEENRKNILNSKSLFMTFHKKLQLATILLIFFNKSWLFWIIIFRALSTLWFTTDKTKILYLGIH